MTRFSNLFIFIFCFFLLATPLLADVVKVGDRVVMRMSAEKAKVVQKRIDSLLQQGADPDKIVAKKRDDGYGVYWGDVLIVAVDAALAKENKSEPKGLALVWAKSLHQAVGPGLLSVSPKNLVLAIGSAKTLELKGLATGPIHIEGESGVVTTSVDGNRVSLKAEAVGRTNLIIKRGQGKVTVPVWVKDWAGFPPKSVSVQITGNPAPASMVAEASLRAVAGSTRLNTGARLLFPEETPATPSVPQGRSVKFTLPIKIVAGENYFPVSSNVEVEVESVEIDLHQSNLLVVSNRPERVDSDGVLMEYTLTHNEPTRLMYSHLNETLADRNLWVNLYNETHKPVKVWIGSTFAGPNRNEVHTGHMAAVRLLRQLSAEAGYVIEIPPRERFVVAHHLMKRRDLLSGFANLQILGEGSLRAEVHSKLAPSDNNTISSVRLGGPFNPFKIHPHGVFAQPFFEEWVDLDSRSEAVRVPYGKSPWLIDFETGLPNTGNFGVLYRYRFVLQNLENRTVDFELTFIPESGPAAGTFLVDGDILEAPFKKRGVKTHLGTFQVQPGEERTIDLTTLPEASSNYPAYIEVRPVR